MEIKRSALKAMQITSTSRMYTNMNILAKVIYTTAITHFKHEYVA